MSIIRKILGPRSKYDKTLPYTYSAKIDVLNGAAKEPIYSYYYSSTICGLIRFLDENGIGPNEVQLFGIYQKTEIQLDNKYCVNAEGKWMKIPDLCRSLEIHYKDTLEACYKGHIEKSECMFDDRDKTGRGPY